MREFRTLIPFLKENKWRYVAGILALLVVDVANLYLPQVTRRFADLASADQLTLDEIGIIVLLVVALGAVMTIGRFLWRIGIFGAGRAAQYWLRDKLFRKYLSLDAAFFQTHTAGDLMAHATNDVFTVGESMGGGVLMLVDSIVMSVITVFMMITTIGVTDALVALISLPFLALAIRQIMVPLQKRSRALQNSFSDLTAEAEENLQGMRVIKATAIEDNRLASFEAVSGSYAEKYVHFAKVDQLFDPAVTLFSGLSFVVFMIYGSLRVQQGTMSLGEFIAVIEYLYLIVWPLIALGLVASRFQRGISSMGRLNVIFREVSHIHEVKEPLEPEALAGRVEFSHVWFRYSEDTDWVLRDVSFVLEPGHSLAILGRTGVGKSTLVHLLLRRFDVTEGAIFVDGVDIRQMSFQRLYETFGPVEQESFLFSRNLAENIAFSADAADMDAVRQAAHFAQVAGDIDAMPEGFETMVGERGVTLSGGQKQRVSIARAYYKDAPVLIMDDALSAVDTETESRILSEITAHRRSVLMISQRVSTVASADQILVLEEGEITQRGTHAQLLEEEGFYRDLYQRQLLESSVEEEMITEENEHAQ